jgi:hypothetical protein
LSQLRGKDTYTLFGCASIFEKKSIFFSD